MMGHMRPDFTEEDFRKATASNPTTECVRVARRGDWVELRDDKTAFGAPDDHRIVLADEDFDRFQAGVRSGEPAGPLRLDRQAGGTYLLRTDAVTLTFTEPEVRAFLSGVRNHEFDAAAFRSSTRSP
jgi:transcriptional antiterminator Rof (Rho-off)